MPVVILRQALRTGDGGIKAGERPDNEIIRLEDKKYVKAGYRAGMDASDPGRRGADTRTGSGICL